MEDISTINEEAIPAEEQQIASEDKEQISIEDSLNGDASDATLDAQHEIIDTPTPEAPKSELEQLISLGLSEREAALVLNDRESRSVEAHLPSDSLPRIAHSPRLNISYGELMEMKEIFSELSDTEINRLYNKVTK